MSPTESNHDSLVSSIVILSHHYLLLLQLLLLLVTVPVVMVQLPLWIVDRYQLPIDLQPIIQKIINKWWYGINDQALLASALQFLSWNHKRSFGKQKHIYSIIIIDNGSLIGSKQSNCLADKRHKTEQLIYLSRTRSLCYVFLSCSLIDWVGS
jgi:hypothetical protein